MQKKQPFKRRKGTRRNAQKSSGRKKMKNETQKEKEKHCKIKKTEENAFRVSVGVNFT